MQKNDKGKKLITVTFIGHSVISAPNFSNIFDAIELWLHRFGW